MANPTWLIGPQTAPMQPWPDGLMVSARYTLQGRAQGAPRQVDYWRYARWVRAEIYNDLTYLCGPQGTFGGFSHGQATWHARPDTADVFRHPLPELTGLSSPEDAALWLGTSSKLESARRVPADPEVGRPAVLREGPRIQVWQDEETGLVLHIAATNARGATVTVMTIKFATLPSDPLLFEPPA